MHDSQRAHGLDDQEVEFVGVSAAADPRNGFGTVYGVAKRVLLDKAVIAGLLDARGNFVQSIVPRDIFPLRAARTAHLGFQETAIIENVLREGRALGAEGATIGGVVGIALHVDDLGGYVLGAIAERIDDGAATDGAVRASRARLVGSTDLQGF